MALYFSTGLRNFTLAHGPYKRALQGGVMVIYSGSAPVNADAATTGTLLCTVTQGGGSFAAEVISSGCIALTGGASGSISSITVNGNEILGSTVSFNGSLAQTAIDVANAINNYISASGLEYIASASGDNIVIQALPGCGTSANGQAITATLDTITATTQGMGTYGTGAAGTNGLQYGSVTGGVLSNTATWQGTNGNTGVAGYFRILGSVADAGAASTTAVRIQGECGINSGDYPMTTTSLTSGNTHTIDSFSFTLPAS